MTRFQRGGWRSRQASRNRSLKSKQSAAGDARRLRVEPLEDRRLLAVVTVDTLDDTVDFGDGVTSLREAVFATNLVGGADTIEFAASLTSGGPATLNLTQGELKISDTLAINGPGANLLTVDASGNDLTPDENNGDGSRIFNIDDGNSESLLTVSIAGLTLTGGDTAGDGGSIFNHESLTLTSSTVTGNSAGGNGGGIYGGPASAASIVASAISNNAAAAGAGVYSGGASLSIVESTLSGNVATESGGGLFSHTEALAISNSTLSGNTAGLHGAGIYLRPIETGTAEIKHSTITANTSGTGSGIFNRDSPSAVLLDHTIVAGNGLTSNVLDVAGLFSVRYSLIGSGTGATIQDHGGNLIGNVVSPINALLGPLADNGGPTLTHALLLNSPAIDAGDPSIVAGVNGPLYDQRGTPIGRVANGKGTGARIDIGAYEVQPGTISGHKWNDLDGDGVWDQPDEPGLSGWIIYLDDNHNSALDPGESWTITDADGGYTFSDVAPGNRAVGEIMLPGWTGTLPGVPEPTSLIVNGGFETGSFSGWVTSGFVINNGTIDPSGPDGPLPPYSGAYSVLSPSSGTRSLYQDVAIPVDSQLTLRWADRIRNHYSSYQDPNQEYRVEIRNTQNQVLAVVFSTNPGDPLFQEWTERSADLSPFAGQTIRIAFVGQAGLNYLNVHVDNVRITSGGTLPIFVTVAEGENVNDVDFGSWIEPTGEIHGAKWNDLNGNGVWDQSDEPGLEGWTIFLDANNNGGLDTGERWTTTDADGRYSFTGLAAGKYWVAELVQPGWTQSSPGPFDASGLIVNGGFESGNLSGWTLQPSGAFVINNGAIDAPGPDGPLSPYAGSYSALSGSGASAVAIYQDVAIPADRHLALHWADQIRNQYTSFVDPTQEYRVEIRNTSNAVIATLFSTNPGDPLLQGWTERSADLSAFAGQTIRIAFVRQASSNYFNIQLDNVRITDDRSAESIPVNLAVGQIVHDVNFGNWIVPSAEIHGYKWNDLDGNGIWDQPDEPALAGTIVYLDANVNGALDYGETWTTTAADGSYAFTGLAAGNYVVAEVVPPGWTQTFPSDTATVHGNNRLFVLRGSGSGLVINELNPLTGELINSFPAPVAGQIGAQGLALGPHSLFFVEGSSSSTHTLWELDPDTGAVIDSDVVDSSFSGPISGLAYLNGRVYVDKYNSDRILVWDPITDTLVAMLTVSADLIGGLTGAADLGALFSMSSSGRILRIDPSSGAVLTTLSPNAGFLDGGLAYANGELIAVRYSSPTAAYRISPSTGASLGSLPLGGTGSVGGLAGDGVPTPVLSGVHSITLTTSQIVTDVNFGDWIAPPAEIHGAKWNDLDGDGIWDQPDEPALAGFLVYLDANRNGALDSGERWTTTAADGSYSFTGLAAGEYVVSDWLQPGWTPTYPSVDLFEFQRLYEVRGTGTNPVIYEIEPATGAIVNSFLPPTPGEIGAQQIAVGPHSLFFIDGRSSPSTHTLWELDLDTGAVIDSDVVDATLTGVIDGLAYLDGKLYVQKSSADRILVWDPATDTLDRTLNIIPSQNYALTGAADLGLLFGWGDSGNLIAIDPRSGAVLAALTPGVGFGQPLAYVHGELIAARSGSTGTAYRIDPTTGVVEATFTLGGSGFISGLGGDGETSVPRGSHIVALVPGQTANGVDFGSWIAPPPEIHGSLWNDLDNNHVWDQSLESGIEGWTVYLDANGDGRLDNGESSTTTEADGSYAFVNLTPGPYKVAAVIPFGWQQTFAPFFVALDPGEKLTDVNVAIRQLPGSISGKKWNDLDGNGIKDDGEPGLPDWTIFIDDNGNGLLDDGERSATTDSSGWYEFAELTPGTYVLAEVPQAGWLPTFTSPQADVGAASVTSDMDFGSRLVPPSAGDFNLDHVVDAADYTLWRDMLGATGLSPYQGADGDGDGEVGPADYEIWKLHFGTVLPALESSTAVEPTAANGAAASASLRSEEAGTSIAAKAPARAAAAELQPVNVDRGFDFAMPSLIHSRQRPEVVRMRQTSADRRDHAIVAWLATLDDRARTSFDSDIARRMAPAAAESTNCPLASIDAAFQQVGNRGQLRRSRAMFA